MAQKKKNIFNIIINTIIILLAILVIYWFIELIFGGSPGLSEFNFAAIILMASFFFKVYREIGETKIEMKHVSIGVKDGFGKIKEDMSSLKNDMSLIKKKLEIK